MGQTTIKNRQISGGLDGWIPAEQTWTYASATTITVPSGAASRYQKGDKIKLTQTTVKYFYIIGVADTVLTVTGGSDYTVANAAITSPYYSHVENPMGFPAYFSYTPTISGFTSNPTISARFKVSGTICTYSHPRIEGTSNAGTVTITLPITPLNSMFIPLFCLDNGSWIAAEMAYYTITGGNATATAYKNLNANFTSSGDKKIAECTITYLI